MFPEAKFNEFISAQREVYDQVRRELKAGRKESHWMWFIFPQISGLGSSLMAKKFAIASPTEAQAYLKHPILGSRLLECTQVLVELPHGNIEEILGYPDDLKFKSSMTLFAAVAPDETLFTKALEKFFNGKTDARTIQLLAEIKRES